MEPDVMPLHASSPPPQDDDDDDDADGEMRSGEDEFGDFSSGISCSPLGFADTSSFKPPPPILKPAVHQPVEQSQPASTVNLDSSRCQVDMERRDLGHDSALHLTNGHAEGEQDSGARSVAVACSPKEETGFADFTVFTEPMAHPWCCGFSPVGTAEQWDGRVKEGTNNSPGEPTCDAGHEVIMKFKPRSHCAPKTEEDNVCTKVQHCECRPAGLVASSQDHLQPQEGEELNVGTRRGRMSSLDSAQTSEDLGEPDHPGNQAVSSVPLTFSENEDLPSFSDDLSFEGASAADMEPNVSSLVSHDDSSEWDRTDNEEEDLEDDRHLDSFVHLGPYESQKAFHHFNQHATQETSATSSKPQSHTHAEDRFADFTDSSLEHRHGDHDHVPPPDSGVLTLGNLPPSDSFADFCSAPTQEHAVGSWAEFKDQSAEVEGKTWSPFREPGGASEEEPDGDGGSRRNSCQASLPGRVQHLLQVSFPETVVPVGGGEEEQEEEEEPLSLSALIHSHQDPESEEATPELSGAQRIQQEMLRLHQDVHSAVGLQFQWGGSHVNSTLLSCLGVDTRNIVFMGTKKQPVTLPAFASGLGLLEPTKEPVPAVCSPRHAVISTGGPPGLQDLSAPSVQEELPSRQLEWSRRGLSSSQDGCSQLNLDYFSLDEEENRSSRSTSPPPGVDRELFELTRSRVHGSRLEDTLSRLLSSAETTCVSPRRPLQDEPLSPDADRVISGLPDLSFMQAKVLMFPSVLVPTALTRL